jgi:hypothetical protein
MRGEQGNMNYKGVWPSFCSQIWLIEVKKCNHGRGKEFVLICVTLLGLLPSFTPSPAFLPRYPQSPPLQASWVQIA